jgi:hypothetical protein
VPGIRIGHLAGRHVEYGYERSYEHARIIVAAELVIEMSHDASGGLILGCSRLQKRFGHGHEQRGWNTLVRDIADAEAEAPLVDEKEVVEVSANLAGGSQPSMYLELNAGKISGSMLI